MSSLVIGREFLSSYGSLPKDVQKKVQKLVEMFDDHTGAGINLEKPVGIADSRGRTVRVDRFWRGVVCAVGGPQDTYVLLDVLPHDQAYDWLSRHTFDVNPVTGALEVADLRVQEDFPPQPSAEAMPATPLLAGVPDKHFAQLGIPEAVTSLARPLATEEEILTLADLLPPSQGHALVGLASGDSPETIYRELTTEAGRQEDVDPDDLAAAAQRPASSAMFYVVRDPDELVELLNEPFEQWRWFLHPSQRNIAYRPTFNGPVKVTGGAGTGKTVVAMHRARFLAQRLPVDERILLTTFTRNLAANLETAFRGLAGEAAECVDVRNVDAVSHAIVTDAEGVRPNLVTDTSRIWATAAGEAGTPELDADFLADEYDNVILANDLRTRDAYFSANRAGQGVPLDRVRRARVWKTVEVFERLTVGAGRRTFLQLARHAADHLGTSGPRYRHIVIDESQDLHPQQWRMLRALAPEAPDDLFLVGDAHQRIYDRRVSLRSLGIHVVGRSHRLRLNYRTTAEILEWSVGVLGDASYDDLDEGRDTMLGYRSALHGPPPAVVPATDRQEEIVELAAWISTLRDDGARLSDVGVAARTNWLVAEVRRELEALGLATGDLDDRITGDAVRVGTMHRMKGLEFRCVAVVGVERGLVPLPAAICPEDVDPLRHQRDVQRERCLLHVACTRARDRLRVSFSSRASDLLPDGA